MLSDGTRKYVWGLGLASSVDTAGAISVSHADGLGSVRALTDASGALIGTYLTDPFGVVLSTGGSSTQPFRFTGEQRDATGLYYLRARMYDPGLGRFLSRDTYSGSPASPLSLNRYSYVHNNPVNATDPTGHCMAKVTREDCGEGGSEDLPGSGDNQCTTTLGGLLSFQGVNARCAQPQSGTVVIEPVQVGPGIVVYVPRVVFATPPGGSGGNSDRGFDRILQDDNLFMRWLNRGHPAAQPLAAATAKKVWEKIQQLGMTPRLDPGHVGRKYWQGPHINIEEMNVHIPVAPSFRP